MGPYLIIYSLNTTLPIWKTNYTVDLIGNSFFKGFDHLAYRGFDKSNMLKEIYYYAEAITNSISNVYPWLTVLDLRVTSLCAALLLPFL